MPSPAAELAARLGLSFSDLRLLEQALAHSSYVHEHGEPQIASNERLEFLGDAVVSLVVSEALWSRHPEESEGSLTTRRAAIVSARGLAEIARRLGLGDHLRFGQGADRSQERQRDSVLASALEAVIGAVYVHLGLDAVREWLLEVVRPELDAAAPLASLKAPKSTLQEHSFAATGRPPAYRVVSAEGPDHAKHYVVEVRIGTRLLGTGEGTNRRDAETAAAEAALARLATT